MNATKSSVPDYANAAPSASNIGNASSYIVECSLGNPFDDFTRGITEVVKAATPENMKAVNFLGRLLIADIISRTEQYFRRALVSAISICPICHELSVEKSVNLGGVIWHGADRFSLAVFENTTFTSRSEIRKACKEYIGLTLDEAQFSDPLRNFDMACQFRHGIVHNAGILPAKNAISLGVKSKPTPLSIVAGVDEVQAVASVASVLVALVNREIFDLLCRRWALDWRKRSDWEPQKATEILWSIWSDFHSREEAVRDGKDDQTEFNSCMSRTLQMYGVI